MDTMILFFQLASCLEFFERVLYKRKRRMMELLLIQVLETAQVKWILNPDPQQTSPPSKNYFGFSHKTYCICLIRMQPFGFPWTVKWSVAMHFKQIVSNRIVIWINTNISTYQYHDEKCNYISWAFHHIYTKMWLSSMRPVLVDPVGK